MAKNRYFLNENSENSGYAPKSVGTSLGRYWADLAAIFGSESQMGISEVVRGSNCGFSIFTLHKGPKNAP